MDKTVFEIYQGSSKTAYVEFGVPSITERKYLETIFSKEEMEYPTPDTVWELHHAFRSWGVNTWFCADVIEEIFGKQSSVDDYIEKSQWLQSEGLKFIYEEARRQKPWCSMALNWCYNEPWITAAGNSLITYPANPKKAYYSVKEALRSVLPSARIEHFSYAPGEELIAELWLLNDSTEDIRDTIGVYFEVDRQKEHILDWETSLAAANTNVRGHKVCIPIPITKTQKISLILEGKCGKSIYNLLLKEPEKSKITPYAFNIYGNNRTCKNVRNKE